jgi:hypothetical protein
MKEKKALLRRKEKEALKAFLRGQSSVRPVHSQVALQDMS